MPELKSPEFVWFGIVSLFQFTQKYTAALKAYGEIYGDNESENTFIDISREALWRQLMSELSKLYDRDQVCGSDNLSLSQLRKLCLAHDAFPGGAENEVIKQLDSLQSRYEELLSKNFRNKKLAHYDLISAFTQEVPAILFSQVEQFVCDTSAVLTGVGKILLSCEVSVWNEELTYQYRNALLMLVSEGKP